MHSLFAFTCWKPDVLQVELLSWKNIAWKNITFLDASKSVESVDSWNINCSSVSLISEWIVWEWYDLPRA